MKNSVYFKFAITLTVIGIVLILWFCVMGFVDGFINPSDSLSLNKSGLVGDFVGGFIGTIFTLAGIMLLYETLSFQRKEFTESRNVFVKQQFDNTFFELIRIYHGLINTRNKLGKDDELVDGKTFFLQEMQKIQSSYTPGKALSSNRRKGVADYQMFYAHNKEFLSSYLRTLYTIYRTIHDSSLPDDEKRKYSKILRAQFSEAELFFLRYNAMTDQGAKSIQYINIYNYLKHLPHFELLEFKHWWNRLPLVERNGLDILFKQFKKHLDLLLDDRTIGGIEKRFKNGRYLFAIFSPEPHTFTLRLTKNDDIIHLYPDISDGFDKFSNLEIEQLLECLVKEIIISSNFNKFNNRRELNFNSLTVTSGTRSIISATVENILGKPLLVKLIRTNHKDYFLN